MKKLWVFGDSFSAPFEKIGPNSQYYIKYKGYIPKVYFDFVSESLNIKGTNYAKGGYDNYSIFNSLCDKVNEISDGDIIIIGWTSTIRFRIAVQTEREEYWVPMVPGHNDKWVKNYSNVFINRAESNLYWQEIISWSKLINKKFNNQIIHFSPFADKYSPVPHTWILHDVGLENITAETNGKIKDTHYSENTHKYLANVFLQKIQNKQTDTDFRYLI